MNANGQGAKDIYFNGSITSATNYNIPAGTHLCHYDSSKNAWFIKNTKIVNLFSGEQKTVGTIALPFSLENFSYALIEAAMYTSGTTAGHPIEQYMYMQIPIDSISSDKLNYNYNYEFIGTIQGTTRRIRFGINSNLNQILVGECAGTSGHIPAITSVWGVL